MADLVTNIAKATFGYYAGLPGATDSLIAVVLEAADLETDDELQDYDTLAALLAGDSNEQTDMGRKALSGVTYSVDDTENSASFDASDVTWTAATGDPTGKIVVCYKPETASEDSAIIPLTLHDFEVTPDGTDITLQWDSDGLAVAENPS